MPIEMLVYKPISSLYATFFSSDIVLRLWDLIIFAFSTLKSTDRKQGLWYILAPAFLVLAKLESLILQAQTCEDVVRAFENGRTLWYDPSIFLKELDQQIKSLFIEDCEVIQQSSLANFIFGQ